MTGRHWDNPTDKAARTLRQAPTGLIGLALGAGAALTGLAFWANRQAREVEKANPPMGNFIEVGGIKLHYLARGSGRPVVFLHGIGTMAQDWDLSILDQAARNYLCVAFDRPGYGWSDRPGWSRWVPEKQAELLRRAVRRMGIERPVLVGHSYGAVVALAWALDYPEDVAGMVLMSGYYYPTRRLDFPLLAAPNIGGLGAVARHTVSPMIGRAVMPRMMERVFAPNAVPDVMSLLPTDMLLRPGQIRAQSEDLAYLREAVRRLSPRYAEVRCPVIIVAGDSDRIVDPLAHSLQLHQAIPHSALKVLADTGHMVHHVEPAGAVDAIQLAWHEADVQARAMGPRPAAIAAGQSPPAV